LVIELPGTAEFASLIVITPPPLDPDICMGGLGVSPPTETFYQKYAE
jgi:hypothetical protein